MSGLFHRPFNLDLICPEMSYFQRLCWFQGAVLQWYWAGFGGCLPSNIWPTMHPVSFPFNITSLQKFWWYFWKVFFFLSRLQLFVKNKYVAAKWLFWGYDSQSSMKTTESWTMAFVFFLWKPFVFGTTDSAKYGEPVNKCRPITHMIHILEDWNHKMEGQPTKKDVKWVLWVYICWSSHMICNDFATPTHLLKRGLSIYQLVLSAHLTSWGKFDEFQWVYKINEDEWQKVRVFGGSRRVCVGHSSISVCFFGSGWKDKLFSLLWNCDRQRLGLKDESLEICLRQCVSF